MARKKKDALVQFNKDIILEAAKTLFESKGIPATTMDDIAKEADCSKSTMYVYFTSKEDILNHIILEQMMNLRDRVAECADLQNGYYECHKRICRSLINFQEEHPVFYNLLLGEIRVTPQDIQEHTIYGQIYEVGEQVNDSIEKILRAGIVQGTIREDIQIIPTVFYLWSGISQVIAFAQQKEKYLQLRLGMSKQEYMEYACDLLIQSIIKREA